MFLTNGCGERTQPNVGGATPGVLWSRVVYEKQTEQARKQCSIVSALVPALSSCLTSLCGGLRLNKPFLPELHLHSSQQQKAK